MWRKNESTGVTPAELNLSRLLKGSLDAELSPQLCDPDTPTYATANQIAEFKRRGTGNLGKARQRQEQNNDKGTIDVAKPAPRWKGPYHVTRKVSPLNFEVVLEDTAEDLHVVNVAQLKPCCPTAEEMYIEQH